MSRPELAEEEVRRVADVVRSGTLSIGPHVEAFERELAEYVDARHAIAVSSGTAALHLALIASGVSDGDVVITTPFSFIASANVILYERAIPVFVDVDEKTGNMDPAALEQLTSSILGGSLRDLVLPKEAAAGLERGRLTAILPVHIFGEPCEMKRIADLASALDAVVIEDACEALGSLYEGRSVGTLGRYGTFAFYPNKQMTSGEGGMIVTDDATGDAVCRALRNQGRSAEDSWVTHSLLGFNYRLDEMSAAVGLVQLRRLKQLLANRARVASWYNERLAGEERVRPLDRSDDGSWFLYVVRVAGGVRRDELARLLAEDGIPTRPYFWPIHLQRPYVDRFDYRRGAFPVAESLGTSCMALPFSGVMTEGEVEIVCEALRRALATLV